MKQEDKELLLKDLCARLPYKVKCHIIKIGGTLDVDWNLDTFWLNKTVSDNYEIKPYLRPMSSMTEDEFKKLKEYSGLVYDQLDLASFQDGTYKCLDFYLSEIPADVVILVFDWLNAHHFDYRGLIKKGLALKAPEGMYKIN